MIFTLCTLLIFALDLRSFTHSSNIARGMLRGESIERALARAHHWTGDAAMDHDAAELDRLALLEACMRIGLAGSPVRELELEPGRALAIIEYAERQHALKSIAGFAIARYRSGFDPRSSELPKGPKPRGPIEPEPVESPPTLSALEYAWSREGSSGHRSIIRMMGVSIGRSADGLAGVLERGWWDREHYDRDGNLVRVDRG